MWVCLCLLLVEIRTECVSVFVSFTRINRKCVCVCESVSFTHRDKNRVRECVCIFNSQK